MMPPFRVLILGHREPAGTPVLALEFGRRTPRSPWPTCRVIDLAPAPANAYGHEVGIAEYVLGAMLALTRGFVRLDAALRRGAWESQWAVGTAPPPPWPELAGKTLGILGYGHIGQALARRARAFDMAICAIRRDVARSARDGLALLGGLEILDEVLRRSDYLAITMPATAATRGLIGEAQLRAMKPTAVLVNVARAEIVDEAALYRALAERGDRAAQPVHLERLAQIGREPARAGDGKVLVVRGDGDGGNVAALRRRARAQPVHEVRAVLAGQVEVAQDQVSLARAEVLAGLAGVRRQQRVRARGVEDRADQGQRVEVVLDDEDRQSRQIGKHGRPHRCHKGFTRSKTR